MPRSKMNIYLGPSFTFRASRVLESLIVFALGSIVSTSGANTTETWEIEIGIERLEVRGEVEPVVAILRDFSTDVRSAGCWDA